jgi:hypothetical protein
MEKIKDSAAEQGGEGREGVWDTFVCFAVARGEALYLRLVDIEKNIDKLVDPEKKETFLQKAKRVGERVRGVAKVAVLMSMLGLSEQAAVDQTKQDPQTEEIISYLSGKAELPDSTRFKMIREEYKKALEYGGVVVPETWDEWPIERVREYLGNAAKNRDFPYANKDISEDPQWVESLLISKDDYNPALDAALRKLQRETGMAKIRWIDTEKSIDAEVDSLTPDRGGWYDGISNTIYLRPPTYFQSEFTVETLVAEQAHAKQSKDNPLGTLAKEIKDMAKIAHKVAGGTSFNDAQSELYSDPGSVEYEAHKEIEPLLKKQLPDEK